MNFGFFNVPRIVFGRGATARLGEFIPANARVLLVYNGKKVDVPHVVAEYRQRGEPTVDDIDRALAVARDFRCDFVIGLGGGSAIDAAKAVAGLLANGGVASDYMEVVGKGQKITQPAVPWIAIPTTAGTGAEVTRNAVIGWPEKKFKASLRSELLMARIALIDPMLHVDVPRDVTARSGLDALCQCIEAYVSNGANPMTDAIALKGAELASTHLRRAYDDGADIEAREGMALAALLSGIALTNAGLGAVHGFAAPLGANFPVPHGVVCGLLLPGVIDANISALKESNSRATLDKYHQLDQSLVGGLGRCAELVGGLTLPSLRRFGMRESDVEPMIQLAKRASSMRYNPVALSDQSLTRILRDAM
jgi:alcohol dehydrogenase class IV